MLEVSVVENLEKALEDFRRGRPVLIYDSPDREGEVDMVYYAGLITSDKIYRLRTEAGGLLCFGTDGRTARLLELRPIAKLLERTRYRRLALREAPYADKSPFSLWVNSMRVHTGISDNDRALTIAQLHEVIALVSRGEVEKAKRIFYSEFYTPGHVPILIAKNINKRKGHTELAVLLAKLAKLEPSVVYAEMLDYGTSLSFEKARKFAERNDIALLTASSILRATVCRNCE